MACSYCGADAVKTIHSSIAGDIVACESCGLEQPDHSRTMTVASIGEPNLVAVDQQMAVNDGGDMKNMSLRDWFVGQAIAGGHGVLDSFEIADDAIRIRKGGR